MFLVCKGYNSKAYNPMLFVQKWQYTVIILITLSCLNRSAWSGKPGKPQCIHTELFSLEGLRIYRQLMPLLVIYPWHYHWQEVQNTSVIIMDIRNITIKANYLTFERSKTCREALASASLNIAFLNLYASMQSEWLCSYDSSHSLFVIAISTIIFAFSLSLRVCAYRKDTVCRNYVNV